MICLERKENMDFGVGIQESFLKGTATACIIVSLCSLNEFRTISTKTESQINEIFEII